MRDEVPQQDRFLFAALAGIAALVLEFFHWGFTVDDAWIVSRVAANGASTGSFSFNLGQAATDAVTPLGWGHVIGLLGALLGLSDKFQFWELARGIGLSAYVLSFTLAGYCCPGGGRIRRGLLLVVLVGMSVPAGLWAGAGLATPVVGLLVIIGAVCHEGGFRVVGSLSLGGAAAWRPELVPFVAALLLSSITRGGLKTRLVDWTAVAMPSLLVVAMRIAVFEHAVPLSSIAKEADWASGVRYSLVTAIWIGVPWLLLFGLGTRPRRWWFVAWGAHLVALVFAGGDWMPGLRLSAALLPWAVWRAMSFARYRGFVPVALLLCVFPLRLLGSQGDDFRRVSERRTELVASSQAELAAFRTIATVDIGWVGMATDATIVDLAGVTDARIARLPGGHTSKAVFPGMFSGRDVDAWVVRARKPSRFRELDPMAIEPMYGVDARLLQRVANLNMRPLGFWELAGAPGGYVLFASRELR